MCYLCRSKRQKKNENEYNKRISLLYRHHSKRTCRTSRRDTSHCFRRHLRPSLPTLERITAALDVEPWQLLAPPSVVEELKQARAQRGTVGGGGLVGVVRVGCEIYTADNVQQLQTIVEKLKQEER